jgi:chromosome partitioning protein
VIVTVANRKGGVGKTTSSVLLAHALARAAGGCVLIDADPQASATQWAQRVAGTGRVLEVPVLAQPTARLGAMLPDAANLVIDTPPAESPGVTAAIDRADVVLVPTSASALDMSQVQATVAAAARRGKPAVVLLTRTRRTRSVGEAEERLRAAGVRLLSTHIPLREEIAMAFGRPVRQLHGYELVTSELLGALPEQPYSVAAVTRRAAGRADAPRPARPRPVAFEEYRLPPAPPQPLPVGLGDDELIQRLKSSMARLAASK